MDALRYRRMHDKKALVLVAINGFYNTNQIPCIWVHDLEFLFGKVSFIWLCFYLNELWLLQSIPRSGIDEQMAKVTLIHDACAFFLAQLVNGSSWFIITIHRNTNSTVPFHILHFESLGVPDVGFHPSVSSLTNFIQMHHISQLSSMFSALWPF